MSIESRDQVRYLRRALITEAARHNLGIIAASTHPIALWRKLPDKDRYSKITGAIHT